MKSIFVASSIVLLAVSSPLRSGASPNSGVMEQIQVTSPINYSPLSGTLLLELNNPDSVAATGLKVEVWDGRLLEASESMAVLQVSQSATFRFQIEGLKRPFFTLEYMLSGEKDTVAIPVTGETDAVTSPVASSMSAVLTSSLLAILGVIAGVATTHITTSAREKSQRNFDARSRNIERYESFYREFLSNWNLSLSPAQLEHEFGALTNRAFVPPDVRTLYFDTIKVFNSSNVKSEKESVAAKLYGRIANLASNGK